MRSWAKLSPTAPFEAVNRMALGKTRKVRVKGKRAFTKLAVYSETRRVVSKGSLTPQVCGGATGHSIGGAIPLPMVPDADRDPIVTWITALVTEHALNC